MLIVACVGSGLSNAWPGLLDHQAWITPASGAKSRLRHSFE